MWNHQELLEFTKAMIAIKKAYGTNAADYCSGLRMMLSECATSHQVIAAIKSLTLGKPDLPTVDEIYAVIMKKSGVRLHRDIRHIQADIKNVKEEGSRTGYLNGTDLAYYRDELRQAIEAQGGTVEKPQQPRIGGGAKQLGGYANQIIKGGDDVGF